MNCSTPGLPVHHQLWSQPKLMSIESVMPSNHLILCHPLLLLPSIFPSIRVFSKESALHIRLPKYWSFSFSNRPSNAYSGLISFRMDWLDLLAVQATLKGLLQYHSSKASVLWHSALFIVQLSHPHLTTGKTIALTRWTFVDKIMSLLFAGSTHSSTRGLRPPEQLERQAEFPSSDKTRPDSPAPTLQGHCCRSTKRRG